MKFLSSFLIAIFIFTLSACQPQSETEEEKISTDKTDKEEVQALAGEKCAISEIPEGWWCYDLGSIISMILPSDLEPYGAGEAGNFFNPTENKFIHIGYFPTTVFDENAQKLIKEKKLKEYMEYEQENICKPNPACKAQIDSASMVYMNLGEKEFLKYEVNFKEETEFKSLHYATIINDHFVDFSTPDGEKIPNPPLSQTFVESTPVETEIFEKILASVK